MLFYIVLAFIAIPAVELILLIALYQASGWELTLGLIIFTGALGGFLAKRQGWQTWRRIKSDLSAGKLPTTDLIHGLFILIAGALLLTPGIMTDIAGFLLLVPAVRLFLGKRLTTKFKTGVRGTSFTFHSTNMGGSAGYQGSGQGDVIDVDAEVTTEKQGEISGK